MVLRFSFRVCGFEVYGLALMVVKSLGFKVYALRVWGYGFEA